MHNKNGLVLKALSILGQKQLVKNRECGIKVKNKISRPKAVMLTPMILYKKSFKTVSPFSRISRDKSLAVLTIVSPTDHGVVVEGKQSDLFNQLCCTNL